MTFYNDSDPKICAWLRELIKAGHLPPGDVDERPIEQLTAKDVDGYQHAHFFAGIGGWPLALALAGWPDDRPVWTGSCPCQPWSDANVWEGGGKGKDDERHAWPAFFRLIAIYRPPTVFGEIVTGAVRKQWLDEVFCHLEGIGYACATAILPACAVGARHLRKRVFWVADSDSSRWAGCKPFKRISLPETPTLSVDGDPLARAWAALDGDWNDLLHSDGISVQVVRDALKAYGNAIVPQVAAAFVRAFLESEAMTQEVA